MDLGQVPQSALRVLLPGLPECPPMARCHGKSLGELWPPPHSTPGLRSALRPPQLPLSPQTTARAQAPRQVPSSLSIPPHSNSVARIALKK